MNKSLWIIVILLIAMACGSCILLGVFATFLGIDGKATKQNNPDQIYQIGQDVIVGKVRWKVLAAEDLGPELKSDNQFTDPLTTSGHFVLVRVEVENRDDNARTFTEGDITDNQGRTFRNNSDAIHFIETGERCILESLNPNLPHICTAIYEIPLDAAGLKLVVGDLAPFGGEADISLGLP